MVLQSLCECINKFILFQIVMKTATFCFYHEEFQIIANNRTKFWKLDQMGSTLENELKKIRRFCSKMFIIYWCLTYLVALIGIFNSITLKEMFFPCWIPDGPYWKTGMMIFQALLVPIFAYILTNFDLMFTTSYLEVYFQFRLINSTFSNMKTIQSIKNCQVYHSFLIR